LLAELPSDNLYQLASLREQRLDTSHARLYPRQQGAIGAVANAKPDNHRG
jgi:hypothetical protein